MAKKIHNIDDLNDQERDILFEMRLLREAGALDPVLETMSSLMLVLILEAETLRRDDLMERVAERSSSKAQLDQAIKALKQMPTAPDIATIRRWVATGTNAGRVLRRRASTFSEADRRWARFQQIARAARIADVNRLRKYVGGSA